MIGGQNLRTMQDVARETQAAGFSGIVFTETSRTAYLSVAAAALATDNLDFNTGIAVAFPRSPMVTAGIAWELADVSRGRFTLGLGTQVQAHIERRYSSEFSPPGPRLREYVQAVRACFRAFQGEERLNFEGKYYKLTLLPAAWTPGPIQWPNIPIYISAVGPWMLRMAGEVADGIHVHPLHSRPYLEQVLLPKVAEGAANAGRKPADVRLAVPVFTIVGDTEADRVDERQRAKSQIAFYGSTKNYAFQFDMLGFEGTSAKLNERLKAGDVPGMADLITDEMLQYFAIECTWDELAGRLRERYDGIAERVILYFADTARRRDPELFRRYGDVAQALRA